MVEQETVFDKEKFKNKRYLKGTPLYEFATKYAKRFTIGLGCAHITFIVLGYYSNVSEEFLTAGPRQRNEKVIQMGLYEMHENDTEMRFQSIKEEFLTSPAYEFYESVVYRIKLLRDRLWKHPETSPETKEEPKTAAKPVPKEASK